MNSKNFLISVDPGKLTGVCEIDLSDVSSPKVLSSYEMTVVEFLNYMNSIQNYPSDVVIKFVCEDFIISKETAKKSPQKFSLELLGVMKYIAYCRGESVRVYPPARKIFAPDERLKKIGFWHRGGEGHANDAFRHALVWLAESHPKETSVLLSQKV